MSTETHLDELEAAGMVGIAAIDPELEYLFRHWLVHEAAYSSLLKQERRALHRLAGETLERLYPDRLGELSPQLAQHFEQGEDPARAVHYLIRAGEHALERTAFQESRAFLDRAAELLDKDPGADPRLKAQVAVDRVRGGWSFTSPHANVEILDRGLPLAEALGDDSLVLQILVWRVMARQMGGEQLGKSAPLQADIDRAAAIAERAGDPGLQAPPLALAGIALASSGRLREGVELLERAVPLLKQENMTIGASFGYVHLANAYALLGEFDKAQWSADEAVRLAEEGDPIARVDGRLAQAFVAKARGDARTQLEISTECEERAEELGAIGCSVVSKYLKGAARLGLDQTEQAREELEKSSDLTQLTYQMMRPAIQGELGLAYSRLGDRDRAQMNWGEAMETAARMGDIGTQADVLLKRGSSLASEPAPPWEEAINDLEQSVALYTEMDARPDLVKALEAYASALERSGRGEDGAAQRARAEALKTS